MNNNIKILHIIAGGLGGGAARGAYWLHLGLRELGVNSEILTNSKVTLGDENVTTILKDRKSKIENMIRSQLDVLPARFYKNRKKFIFSTGFVGFNFTKTKEYKKADIIHLHWINGGFVNVKDLSKIDKPIVWTMRDMWPFTGGCHYSLECDKYKKGCGNCTQLNSNKSFDLSRWVLNRKKKYLPKSMKVVGISHWLSREAKKSELFRDFDVKTISNNINSNDFFPIDKNIAKEILGIKTNKKIILAGSTSLKDFYKGLDAIGQLDKDKYFLCFFGNLDKSVVEKLGFEYKSFGFLYDTVSLRLLYSASNVFVAPSIMDAFGKTLAESMACGTPAVCFNATGPKDILTHKVDGYLAKPYDATDLANGIEWVLEDSIRWKQLSRNAREKVIKEFDIIKVAEKYKDLYENILKRENS